MENLDLLEPLKLYETRLKDEHHDNVVKAFDELQNKAKVDEAANKATCKKLYKAQDDLLNIDKKLGSLNVLKVFCILFIVGGAIATAYGFIMQYVILAIVLGILFVALGIVLLATVYRKTKKNLSSIKAKLEEEIKQLIAEAENQMAPLNRLFDSSISASLFHKTCPLIEMDRIFDVKKYALMHDKFGLWDNSDTDTSTLDLQSGSILGNPFVVFKDLNMNMVNHRYEGRRTISYYTGCGKDRHLTTETLVAHYDAPEPIYSKETYLLYGNEGAQKLSFSRDPSNINSMNEDQIRKYVRKHEKDLDKYAAEQMKNGGNFTPIGNPEFELFFGGLDRDDEVEFRLLFTALGQKAMMDLLKSNVGYGDDFSFRKLKGLNLIQSRHSQGNVLFSDASEYAGIDFELVKEHFIDKNDIYFKALFFDFAPLLSIPLYSQYKTHEYIYKDSVKSNFTPFTHEVCSNRFNPMQFAHKLTKTDVILKTSFARKDKDADVVKVTAHSFDTIHRVEVVEVMGGDGRLHGVDVPWIEYVPLTSDTMIEIGDTQTNNEPGFKSLGNRNVIYARGLVSNIGDKLNVDIKKIKALMK